VTIINDLEDLPMQCQVVGLQAMNSRIARYNLNVQCSLALHIRLADLLFDGSLLLIGLSEVPYIVQRLDDVDSLVVVDRGEGPIA
jgi:hypothetical protein